MKMFTMTSALSAIDESLKFDKSWDQKTGYRTKQVLVCPIIFQKYLMGALQLINRKTGETFTQDDENSVEDLARIIGIALYTIRNALPPEAVAATNSITFWKTIC